MCVSTKYRQLRDMQNGVKAASLTWTHHRRWEVNWLVMGDTYYNLDAYYIRWLCGATEEIKYILFPPSCKVQLSASGFWHMMSQLCVRFPA